MDLIIKDADNKEYKIVSEEKDAEIEEIEPVDNSDIKDKTEDQIISDASRAIERLEETIPKIKVVTLPPDKEIAYKQKFVSQCKLCNHPLRNEAEEVYVKYNFVPHRVVSWFKSKGENITWVCVQTHMKKHCIWDKPLINFIERVSARQDEISVIKQDRIQWNLDALTAANLDLLSQMESVSGDDAIKIYNSVCNGIKVQAQLMKLQHDTSGAQAQAKSMIESNNRKLVNFLQDLLKILDENQKESVLSLIREFQTEEARRSNA